MKLYILIVTLLPALVLSNQNSSLPKSSCPLEDIKFVGQYWVGTWESTWQECGKIFKPRPSSFLCLYIVQCKLTIKNNSST